MPDHLSWMPFFGDAFDESTEEFTGAECWAHWQWCWHAFLNGGQLVNSPRLLKKWGRIGNAQWVRISNRVLARWTLSACGTYWTHPRVLKEVEKAAQQKANARRRRPKQEQSELPLSTVSTGSQGVPLKESHWSENNPMESTVESDTRARDSTFLPSSTEDSFLGKKQNSRSNGRGGWHDRTHDPAPMRVALDELLNGRDHHDERSDEAGSATIVTPAIRRAG